MTLHIVEPSIPVYDEFHMAALHKVAWITDHMMENVIILFKYIFDLVSGYGAQIARLTASGGEKDGTVKGDQGLSFFFIDTGDAGIGFSEVNIFFKKPVGLHVKLLCNGSGGRRPAF